MVNQSSSYKVIVRTCGEIEHGGLMKLNDLASDFMKVVMVRCIHGNTLLPPMMTGLKDEKLLLAGEVRIVLSGGWNPGLYMKSILSFS